MAGSLSDYSENKLLEHIAGKTAFPMPAAVYAALCTTTPTDSSTGSTIVEPTYTGYARKQIAASDFGAAAAGQIANVNAIIFAAVTAGAATIVGCAICDALTGGNVLWQTDVPSHVVDTANTPPTFDPGALTLSLT